MNFWRWGVVLLFVAFVRSFAASEPRAAELTRTIAPLLASVDDVAVRHAEPEFIELIGILLRERRDDDALPYLRRILQADARAYSLQLDYAELLLRKGEHEDVDWRIAQALRNAEDEATIQRARRLSGKDAPIENGTPSTAGGKRERELVLVPLAGVADTWVQELAVELRKRLPVPVTILRSTLQVGPADRTGADVMLRNVRENIRKAIKADPNLLGELRRGFPQADRFESDDAVLLDVIRHVMRPTPAEWSKFEAQLAKAKTQSPQWRADHLLERLSGELSPYDPHGRTYLAVADFDLYSPDSNFVFGMAYFGRGLGVMSATRFTARFNDDSDHRPRLAARLLKQALSSYGQIIGIPRCTNPDCARAYPNSLAEHDAKSADICAQCSAALKRSFDE